MNTQKIITELNDFLKTKHPSSVLQFITSMMAGWTHFDKQKPPSKNEIDSDWNQYLSLLRIRLDEKLLLIVRQSYSNMRIKTTSIPPQVYEKEKLNEVITLLGSMPPDAAMDFMVEVTSNWCFSIPTNYLHLLPYVPHDKSDGAIANAVYTWLVRYTDFWN